MNIITRTLAFLAALLFANAAFSGTLVQCVTAGNAAGGTTLSTNITVSDGNLLHVGAIYRNNAGTSHTITATCGTAAAIGDETRTNRQATHAYVPNVSAGSCTVTLTTPNSNDFRGLAVCEISGLDTVSPLDDDASNVQETPGTSTDAVTSGSMTASAAGSVSGFGIQVGDIGANNRPAAGTGFDDGGTVMQTDEFNIGRAEHMAVSAGSHAATFTAISDVAHLTLGAIFTDASGGGDPEPATLSDATPSGTLETSTTAVVGATTDTDEGTLFVVLSESNNVGGDPEEVAAGEDDDGNPAAFADSAAVTTLSPSVGFTGLSPGTTYYFAVVQVTDAGFSNVLTGSFVTAEAAVITATKLIFGSQPGNVIVGQTFGAFTVRAVDSEDQLDESFEGDVTVALEVGNGVLAGTLTEAAVAGIATFDDVHTDTLNVDAVIQATADGLTAANSDEFDVTAGGTGAAGFPSSSRLGGVLQ